MASFLHSKATHLNGKRMLTRWSRKRLDQFAACADAIAQGFRCAGVSAGQTTRVTITMADYN
eukprot:2202722-Amphidinium_carterae.1